MGSKYFIDESGPPDPPQRKRTMKKNTEKKTPVNTKLHDTVIRRWHLFALQQKLNKENALAEIIKRGTK